MLGDPVDDALNGDIAAMLSIASIPHAELVAASGGRDRILTAEVLRRVVQTLVSGTATAADVQRWASFVRRGYVAGSGGPIKPLPIDYEAAREEDIAEVVGRLDELGDIVDGEPSVDEQELWLELLKPNAR